MATAYISVTGQKILLVTREDDVFLTRSRCKAFERAGYRVSQAYSLGHGVCMALKIHPHLVILDHSYSELEQIAFVDCMHESNPDIYVLCLGPGTVSTDELVAECRSVLSSHPGGETVRALKPVQRRHEFDWT